MEPATALPARMVSASRGRPERPRRAATATPGCAGFWTGGSSSSPPPGGAGHGAIGARQRHDGARAVAVAPLWPTKVASAVVASVHGARRCGQLQAHAR